jgi:hypothetical protein
MADLADSPAPEEDEAAPTREPEDGVEPSPRTDEDLKTAIEGWTEALRTVQKSIDEAAEAIRFLRRTMHEMAPLWQSLNNLEDALRGVEPEQRSPRHAQAEGRTPFPLTAPALEEEREEEPGTAPEEATAPYQAPAETTEDAEWDSFKRRSEQRERPEPPREQPVEAPAPSPVTMEPRASLKPVTLVPDDTVADHTYRMTVEEPGKSVGLVPLHQALSSVAAIRNLSLVGYVNGVASIAIESTDDISAAEVENAINRTMNQDCSVVTHDESTLLVQLGSKAGSR